MKTYEDLRYRNYESEVSKCLLCHDPLCNYSCPQKAKAGDILRSLYFSNYLGAVSRLGTTDCTYCNAPCERSCLITEAGGQVEIRDILMALRSNIRLLPEHLTEESDISTDICGIRLENPFLLSSSVVGSTYDMCKRAFEAGWAGVSFKTICNFPQHETSPRFSSVKNRSNAFFGFKNIEQLSDHSVEENMQIFRQLREEFPTKVIIASIMGQNEAEWTSLAEKC